MTNYASFRQRLDAALRTLNVQQVSEFLIAEGQWHPGQPADPEFAMWMMIAGSPTLRDLHGRAIQWLSTHGHAEEARIFQMREKIREKKPGSKASGKGRDGKKK